MSGEPSTEQQQASLSSGRHLVEILDARDGRVDEYRNLNNQLARNAMEGDRYFLAEGFVTIDRVIDSGHRIRSALIAPSRVRRFLSYLDHPAFADVSAYTATDDVIEEIVGLRLGRCILVAADRQPLHDLAEIAATTKRVVVLEGLNDNENVGTIARAARALGVEALVLSPNCTDPYYRRTVRTSMGESLHMPIVRIADDQWPDALDTLHDAGFETWAMTPAADAKNLWQQSVPERVAILLGAEGPGLTEAALAAATTRVAIPISDAVDSLNVAHAAAITFAALQRPT